MSLIVGRTVWFPRRVSGNSWNKPLTRTPRLWWIRNYGLATCRQNYATATCTYVVMSRQLTLFGKFCGRNKAIRIFYLHEPIKSIQEICGKILSEEERTALFRYDFGSPRLDSDISFTILLTSYFCWKENPANRFYLIYCLEL